jgi:hypothetical protein
MAELNWAMEELERDLPRWQRLNGGSFIEELFAEPEREPTSVSVEPKLVILDHENQFTAWITAAGRGVPSEEVKLRYAPGLIRIERWPSISGVTNFRVRVAPNVGELGAEQSEIVEVHVPGGPPASVRVAVAAFSAEDSLRWRRNYREAFRHSREVLAAGAAFLGAMAVLLLLV